jgi:hypothetical protein
MPTGMSFICVSQASTVLYTLKKASSTVSPQQSAPWFVSSMTLLMGPKFLESFSRSSGSRLLPLMYWWLLTPPITTLSWPSGSRPHFIDDTYNCNITERYAPFRLRANISDDAASLPLTYGCDQRRGDVYDALDIGPRCVDRRVQLIIGDVDTEIRRALLHDAALHVDLQEARGRHLVVKQTVGINQKVLLVLIEARGHHAPDPLGPTVQIQESKDGGEFAAQELLVFRVAHTVQAAYVVYRHDAI